MTFAAPEFSFTNPPVLLSSAEAPQSQQTTGNFYRGARWSPDGAAVLAALEDRSMEVFVVDVYSNASGEKSTLEAKVRVPSPAPLLSYAWHPRATIVDPSSWRYMRCIRDHPMQLVAANSGKIQATYPVVDHKEQFVAPHSLCFSDDGQTVYGGHENSIEIHTLARPGCEGIRISTSPSRKSSEGQKGIISALSLSHDVPSLLAAGSFSRTLGLYDTQSMQLVELVRVPGGGVTSVQFHPTMPYLVAGSRMASEIYVYDVRDMHSPVHVLPRRCGTHQRLDVLFESWGRGIISGDDQGYVQYWEFGKIETETRINISQDPVTTAALHPYAPVLVTTTGARVFDDALECQGSLSIYDLSECS